MDFRTVAIRAVSGAVYVGAIILAIWLRAPGVMALSSLFAVLAIYELESNTLGEKRSKGWIAGFLLEALAAVSLIFCVEYPSLALLWFVLIFLRFCLQIFDSEVPGFKSIGVAMFAQIYIVVPMVIFATLSVQILNPWVLVALISMIWINDTGAFLVGCSIGKHRLYPRLSPKKSWEGFIGGLVFNVGVSVGFYFCFREPCVIGWQSSLMAWIITGIVITVLSTIGDLFESMIKRELNIKDSGNLIPGHGGILDRIDSLLFVLPGLYILFFLFAYSF